MHASVLFLKRCPAGSVSIQQNGPIACIMDKIFEKFRNSKIHYHSIKEHLRLSKIAKFGCEML